MMVPLQPVKQSLLNSTQTRGMSFLRSTRSSGMITCLHSASALSTATGLICLVLKSAILATKSDLFLNPMFFQTRSVSGQMLTSTGISGRLLIGFSMIPIGLFGKLCKYRATARISVSGIFPFISPRGSGTGL